eukprot:TRINITY_DN7695_c0_g1_i1.p1 TRINITY_DN7695_c0_g1~~TRINITY_DN7695_c0_g1_i1.p1  ORF type:complete len:667 (+),score=175.39 TRINITY_DN7695_c0_g1_i1:645-2645(+)
MEPGPDDGSEVELELKKRRLAINDSLRKDSSSVYYQKRATRETAALLSNPALRRHYLSELESRASSQSSQSVDDDGSAGLDNVDKNDADEPSLPASMSQDVALAVSGAVFEGSGGVSAPASLSQEPVSGLNVEDSSSAAEDNLTDDEPASQRWCGGELWNYVCCGAKEDDGTRAIACDSCTDWVHFRCLGWNQSRRVKKSEAFFCDRCKLEQKREAEQRRRNGHDDETFVVMPKRVSASRGKDDVGLLEADDDDEADDVDGDGDEEDASGFFASDSAASDETDEIGGGAADDVLEELFDHSEEEAVSELHTMEGVVYSATGAADDHFKDVAAIREKLESPAWPGCPQTLIQLLLMLLAQVTESQVSWAGMEHVLRSYRVTHPDGSVPKSVASMRAYLRVYFNKDTRYAICPDCKSTMYKLPAPPDEQPECEVCHAAYLKDPLRSKKGKQQSGMQAAGGVFYYLPLWPRLSKMLSIAELLRWPWKRQPPADRTAIDDVYDGANWQAVFRALAEGDIGLLFNADAVRVFKKKRKQQEMWLFLVQILNLPHWLRIRLENILVWGLVNKRWINESAGFNLFVKPMLAEIRQFGHLGVKVIDAFLPAPGLRTLHYSVVMCACDNPAESKLSYHIGANGYAACEKCLGRGVGVKKKGRKTRCTSTSRTALWR